MLCFSSFAEIRKNFACPILKKFRKYFSKLPTSKLTVKLVNYHYRGLLQLRKLVGFKVSLAVFDISLARGGHAGPKALQDWYSIKGSKEEKREAREDMGGGRERGRGEERESRAFLKTLTSLTFLKKGR